MFKKTLKENKKTVLVLAFIILAGIFLRTYKFHDWLRFSVDQPRDAKIISAAIEGRAPLPLLGPKANTTTFHLGPAYYYFSYASAKIFGNSPDKMAYPSLFSGILAIPLLFIFLREYFNKKTSLAVTTVLSFSYFMVINSRFSSNPNLIPFFLLLYLYALLKILNGQGKNMTIWSALAGISLGIGIQLHTTLLIIMPLMTLCAFAYFLKKKFANIGKGVLIIFAISLVLNASQIINEFNTGWSNSKSFLSGFQQNSDSNLANSAFLISACQIQANFSIVSSLVSPFQLENDSKNINCENVFQLPRSSSPQNNLYYLIIIFLSVIFSLAGYFFLVSKFKKESDIKRKNFLGVILAFNIISFLILIPVAKVMQTGYFIILFFVPFILLGLLLDEINLGKYRPITAKLAPLLIILLIACSLAKDYSAAAAYSRGEENNSRSSTLGEIELMSQYIVSASKNSPLIYFSGEKELFNRYYKPILYFTDRANIDNVLLDSTLKSVYDPGAKEKVKPNAGIPIFYIQKNTSKKYNPGQLIKGYEILSDQKFSSQTILLLKN